MSGNELTSEGTPHCCLFPKMNQSIVLQQRTCRLQLKAARLFCVIQEDPWGLHMDTGPEASLSRPASFLSLYASSCDHGHGLSSRAWDCGTGCSPAWNPFPQVLSLQRPWPTILRHTRPSAHADSRHFSCTGFPQSTSPSGMKPMLPQGSGSVYLSACSPVWHKV